MAAWFLLLMGQTHPAANAAPLPRGDGDVLFFYPLLGGVAEGRGGFLFPSRPAVRQTTHAQLAALAPHRKVLFNGIKHAQASVVKHMCPKGVVAG